MDQRATVARRNPRLMPDGEQRTPLIWQRKGYLLAGYDAIEVKKCKQGKYKIDPYLDPDHIYVGIAKAVSAFPDCSRL